MASDTARPLVLGVYSLRQTAGIGSGSTTVDHESVTYWYVRQLDANVVEVQPLTAGGLPSGIVKKIGVKEFITSYTPEPFHYSSHPQPVLESLASKLAGGEDASLEVLDESELAALKALMAAPLDLPDPAAPGYGEARKALMGEVARLLGLLICRGSNAKREHCERCNTFGVTLRKDKRFDESIAYFNKALEVEKSDENLYFNMARAYYDKGDFSACGKALDMALRLNPQFGEASRFVRHLSRREDAAGG